jgi:hypothetical protein
VALGWLQVDTEINLQLGELTVRKQQILPLPKEVFLMPDFENLFGAKVNTPGTCDRSPPAIPHAYTSAGVL